MKKHSNPPPVGGETIVILGTAEVPGTVLFQCLSCRGYLPILAASAQEARNLFASAMVSALLIMDDLPVDAVRELCIDLRRDNHVTPIIVLLNDQTRDEGIRLLESGADHFDVEPVRIEELQLVLHAFTRRTVAMIDNLIT
ncbi:hypothetical protein ACOXXX_10700 [Thalassococcus sp. BH17M4-6]|uniref:hypothetical protein n=1 Tax=Thalassococcus sp. BH17M4-6 TaxID=3413148 RepID=UPI003BE22041